MYVCMYIRPLYICTKTEKPTVLKMKLDLGINIVMLMCTFPSSYARKHHGCTNKISPHDPLQLLLWIDANHSSIFYGIYVGRPSGGRCKPSYIQYTQVTNLVCCQVLFAYGIFVTCSMGGRCLPSYIQYIQVANLVYS